MRRRERWTEGEVLALPSGEHDYFDRKSGRLFGSSPASNRSAIGDTVSKALSAFCNTEGGHLVLGVADDGTLDGVPAQVGSTSTRDWLEQQIPNLVEPPLHEFRIHNVEKSAQSRIPIGREVVIIDVEDSLEIRQATDHVYYYRAGGRSVPAKHSYLEQRRQRMRPKLDFKLTGVKPINAYQHLGGIFLETEFQFIVENVGQMAAEKWHLAPVGANIESEFQPDYFFNRADYPIAKGKAGGIRLDNTILPRRQLQEVIDVGFFLHHRRDVKQQLETLIKPMKITCHLSLEVGPGIEKSFDVAPVTNLDSLAAYISMMTTPLPR